MFAFAMSTTVFLLTFVLPKFTVIYAAKKAALPTPTRILMAISSFIVGHYILLPVLVFGLVAGVWMGLRTKPGLRAWHWMQLRLPLLGAMYRKLHLSRGLRMVGTMAGAGVSLIDCVTTANDLCANSYFRDLWTQVLNEIQAGKQLSDPLFQSAAGAALRRADDFQRRKGRQARGGHGTGRRLQRAGTQRTDHRHDPVYRAGHDPGDGRDHRQRDDRTAAADLHDQPRHRPLNRQCANRRSLADGNDVP